MRKVIIFILFLAGIAVFSAEVQNKSVYTSTKEKDCKRPTGKFKNVYQYDELDDAASEECPGYKNYHIFKVFESGREWIDISDGTKIWTTKNEVMGGNFGTWPHIKEGVAEWRINSTGEVKALIFRIEAYEDELTEKFQSRLYVIGMDKGNPKLCGIVKTNEEAEKLADKGNCIKELSLKE